VGQQSSEQSSSHSEPFRYDGDIDRRSVAQLAQQPTFELDLLLGTGDRLQTEIVIFRLLRFAQDFSHFSIERPKAAKKVVGVHDLLSLLGLRQASWQVPVLVPAQSLFGQAVSRRYAPVWLAGDKLAVDRGALLMKADGAGSWHGYESRASSKVAPHSRQELRERHRFQPGDFHDFGLCNTLLCFTGDCEFD
jgi:hypothetical protein